MFDDISAMIRKQKKNKLRPDMDSAGQEAQDPNEAWDDQKSAEVNEALGEKDHAPASASMMGENDSSQSPRDLKKIMARISSYFDGMGL